MNRNFKETCEVAPAEADYQDRGVLNSHQQLIVIGLLLENPGLYLGEVCGVVDVTGVHVSASTICIIHKHGFTRKISRWYYRGLQNTVDNLLLKCSCIK